MAVETLPLTPALAAWENEGGARGDQESERVFNYCVAAEIVAELPPHLA